MKAQHTKTYTIKEGDRTTTVSANSKEKAMLEYFGVDRVCKVMAGGPNEYSNMRFSKNRRSIYRRATIDPVEVSQM